MTGSKCLLDTSVIIHSFKKVNDVVQKLDNMAEVFVPVIVIGELLFGAYKSSSPEKNLQQINIFLDNCRILVADRDTSEHYGRIKTLLYQKGKPLPENDIWIAAITQQHDLALFTTDKHFNEVDGIMLIS
jgi:tRNA(fMet)-specific endonuclease VapC